MPDNPSTILEVRKDLTSQLLKGEVLSIGPWVRAQIEVGECVLFTQSCKEPLKDFPDLMLIRDGDLVGQVPHNAKVTDGRSPEL